VVVAFAKKVFYVQCHWGATDAPGYMLHWAYNVVVVKVGLYGDPFDWDYECFNSWSFGITVLLEKIMENTYVNKLQAICLFEAVCNWLNKLIVVKRMMQRADKCNTIPEEMFSHTGRHCDSAAMSKTFFCNGS